MGEKKSSFHIGNEFNGKGKKVCLRATQHNTCTTVDFMLSAV